MVEKPIELALLVLLAILWGASYPLIKVALDTIPPITLIAIRVSVAAAFLLILTNWQRLQLPRDTATWRKLFIQAFLNSIGAWTLLAWGQQFVDSALASVLNSTAPIFVFFITLFFTKHEPATKLKLLGASLGLSGVILIVGIDVLNGIGNQTVAQLAIIVAAMLYAGAAIYGKNFSSIPPLVVATGTMLWATLCLVPLSLAIDQPWTLQISASSLAAAVVLGAVCTGVALQIYFRLITTLGSLGVASQAYLRAGVGVTLGVVFLGETITPLIGAGIAVAVIGVALINAPVRPATRSIPPTGDR